MPSSLVFEETFCGRLTIIVNLDAYVRVVMEQDSFGICAENLERMIATKTNLDLVRIQTEPTEHGEGHTPSHIWTQVSDRVMDTLRRAVPADKLEIV